MAFSLTEIREDYGRGRFDEGELKREDKKQGFGYVEFDFPIGHPKRDNQKAIGYI